MTNDEWIDDVLGKPWVDRSAGPDAYDCWGLVVDYCRRVLNVEPPELRCYKAGKPVAECYPEFRRQPEWKARTLGFLFVGLNDEADHVGVVIGDRLIHADGNQARPNGGTVCNHPMRRVARLFNFVEFYEYVGNDSTA